MWKTIGAVAITVLMTAALATGTAHAAGNKSKPPVPFTEDMLSDDGRVAAGEEIWKDQCAHCHGAKAYPGKAPKLKPRKYKPDFVYRRVTDGFRKMPAWDEVYTDDERMNVTIYILSKDFSP